MTFSQKIITFTYLYTIEVIVNLNLNLVTSRIFFNKDLKGRDSFFILILLPESHSFPVLCLATFLIFWKIVNELLKLFGGHTKFSLFIQPLSKTKLIIRLSLCPLSLRKEDKAQ
ncbi:hypothetical protein ES703_52940 [subsurface metagenome]